MPELLVPQVMAEQSTHTNSIFAICVAGSVAVHVLGFGGYAAADHYGLLEKPELVEEPKKPKPEKQEPDIVFNLQPAPQAPDPVTPDVVKGLTPEQMQELKELQQKALQNEIAEAQQRRLDALKKELAKLREKEEDKAKLEVMLPKPKPPKKKFVRTADDQLKGRDESAMFEGVNDTIAASDARPDMTAPDRPSSTGDTKSVFDDLVNQDYQDGDLDSSAKGSLADSGKPVEKTDPTPPNPMKTDAGATDLGNSYVEDKKGSKVDDLGQKEFGDGEEVRTQLEVPEVNTPEVVDRSETLKHGEAIPLPVPPQKGQDKMVAKAEPQEGLDEGPKEKPLDKGQPNGVDGSKGKDPNSIAKTDNDRPAEKESEKAGANQVKKKPGFRGEVKQKRMIGALNRRSKVASVDVKASPQARYHNLVMRAVEQKWQRTCRLKADYVLPGVLTVRFFVKADGSIFGLQVLDQLGNRSTNWSFTSHAIQTAAIPAMNAEMRKLMKGEPHEVVVTFNFN